MTAAASDAWIEQARAVPIESEVARRGGLKLKRSGNELIGPCPKCGGDDRFGVNIVKQVFNCRGCGAKGDVIDMVRHLDGVDFTAAATALAGDRPEAKPNGKSNGKGNEQDTIKLTKVFVGKWRYNDKGGELLFETRRIEYQKPDGSFVLNKDGKHKKQFFPYRIDPRTGEGVWKLKIDGVPDVPVVPYGLPELLKNPSAPVFVVEGELKVHALRKWGLVATCNAGGAEKWTAEHAVFLRGRDVAIIPDNDEPGRKHAEMVARSLIGIAKEIHIIELPGLAPKEDIIDWIKRGNILETFSLLVEQSKPWAAERNENDAADVGKGDDEGEEGAKQQSNVFNATGLNQMRFNPIKYVVHGYIVEGLTLFAGKPKIGKSWLLLHAAFAVAEGSYTLGGVQCEQGDVLYCALEDNPRRLQSRMTKLFGTQGWPTRLNFTCEMPRLAEGGLDFVKSWIESAERPRLVIIDTLAMVRMPNRKDQTSYDADYAAVKELRDLALRYSLAIVLVHHLRKAEADDPFDTISGTLGLTGAPDTIMIISRDNRGTILHAKGRDLIEIEKAIRFDAGTCTWIVLGEADAIRKSSERTAIVAALEEAGAEPIGPNQIASACDMKSVNVRNLLKKMVADGVVEKTSFGKYTLAKVAAAAQAAAE
jgi:hypothetical protein